MESIRIVTDPTCDLPAEFLQRYGITIVPTYVIFGTEAFKDGVTIDYATFMRRLQAEPQLPKTAQPSPADFVEAYERLGREGHSVLSIHVTGKLSGTFRSAEAAALEVAGRVRVLPFDSLAGSAVLGWMCIEAARMAEAGQTLEAIQARLEAIRPRARILIALDTLKYAVMGGRVPRLQGLIASALNVKPLVVLRDGSLQPADRVRTRARQLERLIEMAVAEMGSAPCYLGVVHAAAAGEAEALLASLRARLNVKEYYLNTLGSSLTVHFGPGAVGACLYPA